jgi:hypothetical protein
MFHMAPCSFEGCRKGVGVVDAELELGGPRAGHPRGAADHKSQLSIVHAVPAFA